MKFVNTHCIKHVLYCEHGTGMYMVLVMQRVFVYINYC